MNIFAPINKMVAAIVGYLIASLVTKWGLPADTFGSEFQKSVVDVIVGIVAVGGTTYFSPKNK